MSKGLRLISEVIPVIAGKAFSRKYIMIGRLVTRWTDIVGPELAGKTQPVKLRYFKKKKDGDKATASLDIAASTADATLLHYQKDLILERINQIFGDRWITAIRFVPKATNTDVKPPKKRPKPLTEKQKADLSGALENVQDEEMREKLQKLGQSILQDRQT